MFHYSELQGRLEKLDLGGGAVKVEYQKPLAGARIRPDGQEIKWEVTFPVTTTGYQRGELPFFCHDLTPRSLRVLFSEDSVTHPSSALGVKNLSIFVRESRLPALAKAYPSILGIPKLAAEENFQRLGVLEVKGLREVEGGHKARFSLQTPSEESQLEALEKRGGSMLGDLVLGVPAVSGSAKLPKRIDAGDGGLGGIFLDLY
jgi:hypothetical protein